MAMERLFGWFSGTKSEEEGEEGERERDISSPNPSISSRERELRPLTDRAVTTYGSHGDCDEYGGDISDGGRVESDFVIIVSDCEDPEPCECDVVSGERAQGQLRVPSSRSGGILKTRHKPEATSCHHRRAPVTEWRSRADLPVRMKGLQAALHRGKVLVGGGYTGHTPSEMTVYEYDPNFDLWAELPVSPMRWFGIAEYKGQLVLVGGKDMEGGRGMKMTNRIAVFDDDESCWLHPFPPMSAARAHPVVFSHAHLLVVAGGRKGVLDFNVEVFDGTHWCFAPPLPAPCSALSSLIHCGSWYLLGGQTVTSIHHTHLQTYLESFLQEGDHTPDASSSSASWDKLAPPPFFVSRIMSLGRQLVAFPLPPTEEGGGASVQVYLSREEEGWSEGGRVPHVSGTASPILLPRGDLLLMGGDVDGIHYSNKVYRVSLRSTGPQRKRAKFASVT